MISCRMEVYSGRNGSLCRFDGGCNGTPGGDAYLCGPGFDAETLKGRTAFVCCPAAATTTLRIATLAASDSRVCAMCEAAVPG
jgi:hypothetical protein